MIRVICVGKLKDAWVRAAVEDYAKRARLEVVEVRDEPIGKDIETVKRREGERILKLVKDDYLIALDVGGKQVSSEEFASLLGKLVDKKVCFVIGGPVGLSKEVLVRANLRLSLSELTFTYQLARLLLVEQVYRARMSLSGREYSK